MFIQKLFYKDIALEVSYNSHENTQNQVLFRKTCRTNPATVLKEDSISGAFLRILQFFKTQKTFFGEL